MSVAAQILGIAYALPERVVTNAELHARHPSWQVPEVLQRTGVEERRWCSENETALDLAERACHELFARLALHPSDCDVILFCTQSPDFVMTPNATLLQHRLGMPKRTVALDYTLACSGFVYGLYLAKALICSCSAQRVLLVTAETYSRRLSIDDRGPATLFGDGGAATLIGQGAVGLGDFVLGSDGGNAACFMVPAGGARCPSSDDTRRVRTDAYGNERSAEHLLMDGAHVLDFVKREIPAAVATLCNRARVSLADVDLVVFHQASQITIDHLNRVLGVPPQKQFTNLRFIGNTVSASLPIALRQAEEDGVLRSGMNVVLVGFGVGLSWGACLVTWT